MPVQLLACHEQLSSMELLARSIAQRVGASGQGFN
jgi:hypothetical protein